MKDFTNRNANILSGTFLASQDKQVISQQVLNIKSLKGRAPSLSVILVGDHPSSLVYVAAKQKACEKVGIDCKILRFPFNTSHEQIQECVFRLNDDSSVDGILIQLPLPAGLNSNKLLDILNPLKDVDGLIPQNLGLLLSKRPRFIPCTPLGCMDLINQAVHNLSGKNALVLGRSILVGMPMAILLEQANSTVNIAHSAPQNLKEICKAAEIVVAAIGKPAYLTADFIKPGAVVVDVGINRCEGKLMGDVDESVWDVAAWLTPVPGGVGPMTISKLLSNTLKAAELAT